MNDELNHWKIVVDSRNTFTQVFYVYLLARSRQWNGGKGGPFTKLLLHHQSPAASLSVVWKKEDGRIIKTTFSAEFWKNLVQNCLIL